ncbi:MAG: divalent-cation tolerance protein CutA [Pseudomonadota bacterium]|nr:divalent-cation tolerance protein CutA [Pseudomonadota bacterium]
MTQCLIYMTASNDAEARAIARILVQERLAACVNILAGMRSVYRWEGEIQEESEIVLIAKTRRDRVPALTDRVTEIHSYDCPCVVAIPIDGGNPDFLDWIDAETS